MGQFHEFFKSGFFIIKLNKTFSHNLAFYFCIYLDLVFYKNFSTRSMTYIGFKLSLLKKGLQRFRWNSSPMVGFCLDFFFFEKQGKCHSFYAWTRWWQWRHRNVNNSPRRLTLGFGGQVKMGSISTSLHALWWAKICNDAVPRYWEIDSMKISGERKNLVWLSF
jgi:hypothetical protein